MKYQAENAVSSYFYYMWNTWCEEECKTVFKEMYPHFWETLIPQHYNLTLFISS